MKNIFLLLAGLLLPYLVFSQGENNNWYFGGNAGVTFNGGSASSLPASPMYTFQGVATISDSNGNLLFYTNGQTIWNRQHQVMQNGTGLTGSSSAQQTIILPYPGHPQKYYVFTMGTIDNTPVDVVIAYSVVDMTQGPSDNHPTNPQPLGAVDVNYKNIPIKDEFGQNLSSIHRTEAITAVKHSDNSSYWVLIPNGNLLYSYRLHYYGLDEIPVTSELDICFCGQGEIKISPNLNNANGYTNLISITQWDTNDEDSTAVVYSFDNNTGQITPDYQLSTFSYTNPKYSSEFNSDGTLLYISRMTDSRLVLIDLLSQNTRTLRQGASGHQGGDLQRAVNGIIYYSIMGSNINSDWLSGIQNPDSYQLASFGGNLITLAPGTITRMGLPQLVPILTDDVCLDNLHLISPEANHDITYQVSNIITTSQSYRAFSINGEVRMIAGAMIELLPNTHIIKGADFLGKIEECPNTISARPNVGSGSYARATINLDEVMTEIDSQLHIYPNPSSEIINVSSTDIIDNVTITDLNGRTVKQVTSGVNEAQINISDLAQGVYILNATSNGKSFTQKIVKQ